MTPVYAELNRWLRLPYLWGESDCVTICADWVSRWHGVDPAADLRLTYGSAGECERATRFFSDPLGCIAPRMAAAGLNLTTQPKIGDVGLLLLPVSAHAARPHGAICLGKKWAAKTLDGSVQQYEPFKVLAAWSVNYAHPSPVSGSLAV